jgi:prolyl oligopeptidase
MKFFYFLPAVFLVVSCWRGPVVSHQQRQLPPYPDTKRENLIETLHGVVVADPYRWLEATDDPAVKAWTEAQNAFTLRYIQSLPHYEPLKKRLTELWNFDKMQPRCHAKENSFSARRAGSRTSGSLPARERIRCRSR